MLGVTYKLCKLKNLDLSIQDTSSALHMLDTYLASRFDCPQEEPKKIRADGKQFSRWLQEEDPDALKVYRELIIALGALVFNTQICYAPEKIVIGGGFSANERVIPDLREELERYYNGMGLGDKMKAEVVRSCYFRESNLLGAAYNYLLRKKGIKSVKEG